MKLKLFIFTLLLSLVLAQDRSTVFSTGSDEPNPAVGGYAIQYTEDEIYGAADRFYLSNEYMLERVYAYLSFVPENIFDQQSVRIEIAEDDNSKPGEVIVSEIISLDPSDSVGKWYSISLLDDCVKTQASTYYWVVLIPLEGTNATWVYSEEDTFRYSITEDGGETWGDMQVGYAGSAAVTAEQIYIPPFDGGDVNGDFIVNILDVVMVVQFILGNAEFNEDQIAASDLTQDGGVNILDVIAMMNIITNPPIAVTDFMYEDINVNSDTFGELVGPPLYEGMISCYYFGKAG